MLAASQPHPSQEWSGTSRSTTLFLSFILNFTHFSLLFHYVHYENGGLVLVYGRVRPGLIRSKWSGSPWPKYGAPSRSSLVVRVLLQHNTKGPVSVMAGYILAFLVVYIPAQWSNRRKWDYGAEVPKRRVQSQPKKEGVDMRRSTDGQTLKRKESIFREVQTDKSQNRKS